MPAVIPHLALPFRYVNGRPAVVEQDSPEEIANCVEAILRYPQGYRPELPDFGRPEQTFDEGDLDLDEIRAALDEWEPRADSLIEDHWDLFEAAVRRVGIRLQRGDESG